MSRRNHLFIHNETTREELENAIRRHGESISYLKIGSMMHHAVDIERVADIVRGTGIPLCIGGGVARDEAMERYSRIDKLRERHKKTFRDLAQQGVTAIELPASLLANREITQLAGDFFEKKVVEVGEKADCLDAINAPSVMQEGIEAAEQLGADHIVLEGSLFGNCGIYHRDKTPNILAVYGLVEQFEERTRCIIEASSPEAQDVWRAIFGPGAHIGNIDDFGQINTPIRLNVPENYGDRVGEFKNRAQALAEVAGVSWDDVARDDIINRILLNNIAGLGVLSDSDLQHYMEYTYRGRKSEKGMKRISELMGEMIS